jgi:metal transporter CNNM
MLRLRDFTEAVEQEEEEGDPLLTTNTLVSAGIRCLMQQQEQADGSLSSSMEDTTDANNNVDVSSVFMNLLGVLMCVTFVAIIAGLFLGLLTLDVLDLRIIQRASIDEDERMYATALIPVCEQRHRVLVTLLLLNALAYEALPIFMDRLVPTWVAILLSTTVVLLFGEILPSGVFTGPHQLYLGYKVLPLMKFFLIIMYPFAAPMAWLLDYLVSYGKEASHQDLFYNRGELSALVRIQYEERIATKATKLQKNAMTIGFDKSRDKWAKLKSEILEAVSEKREHTVRTQKESEDDVEASMEDQMHPPLHAVEIKVMEGSLQLKTRIALDVYTPINKGT